MQTQAVSQSSNAATAARNLPPDGDSYTVKRGDNLSEIAAQHGVSLANLLAANPQIRNPNVIDVGDKINLPAAQRSYTVRPGDTLGEIASANGTTAQALANANGIDNPNRIFPGDVLRIPRAAGNGGPVAANDTPAVRPASPTTTTPAPTSPAASTTGAQVTPGELPRTTGLNEAQRFDLYAGYINQFGSAGAQQDLAAGRKVALSLRVDTSTDANRGNGVYDDRMVLVWQDASGTQHAQEFNANTDPSGQYEPGGPYTRKPVGSDYGGDSRGDQGRLADGTYAYTRGTFLGAPAMLSGADQVTQRDTNHDGRFNDNVTTPRSDYGMHIHVGGQNNTYSAGCFTLPPGEHSRFFDTLGGQNSLRNVVVNTKQLAASTVAAPAPAAAPVAGSGSRALTEADWQRAATALGVNVASIKAVANVEAPRSGFLDDGRPKILFEAAQFGRLTGDVYNRSHPNISSAEWDRSLYVGGAGEYTRLAEAQALNDSAALKAASWGRFQIMGFNHAAAGFSNVQDFVRAMQTSEGQQLDAFVNFIKADPSMHRALQSQDWAGFARAYNGPGYAANQYDTKIEAEYNRLNR